MKISFNALLIACSVLLTASVAPVFAQTAASPATNWQSSATLGVTIARGNTDTTLVSFGLGTQKKWTKDSLALGADALYGESRLPGASSSTETADTLHAFAQYDRTFTTNIFGYARADGLHDGIADIQYRLTIGPGAGYYFIKNKTIDLSLEAGPSYIAEKLGDDYESYVALRVAEKFHWAISERSKLWETIEYLPQVDNFDNYIVNFELGVESALNKSNKLALRTVLQDTYNNLPAAGRLKNDLKLIAGVTYKF